MRFPAVISGSLVAGLTLLGVAGCSPELPVIQEIQVSIDAANNCSMNNKPVECASVATSIQSQYPTSRPRVDICLEQETRFEAASEVMKSVTDAGLEVGGFSCAKAGSRG